MKEEHNELRIATKRFTRISVKVLQEYPAHVAWISVKIYWLKSVQDAQCHTMSHYSVVCP